MTEESAFERDRDQRELRLRIGEDARELLGAAVRRDAFRFIALVEEVMRQSLQGVEVAPDAVEVPGPSYLQAFLVYVMRVAAAAIREALDGEEDQVEDLLMRVCTALEIGDTSI